MQKLSAEKNCTTIYFVGQKFPAIWHLYVCLCDE